MIPAEARAAVKNKSAAVTLAAYAYPGERRLREVDKGRVVGYCESPMYCIEREDGSTFWWRADLTDVTP